MSATTPADLRNAQAVRVRVRWTVGGRQYTRLIWASDVPAWAAKQRAAGITEIEWRRTGGVPWRRLP